MIHGLQLLRWRQGGPLYVVGCPMKTSFEEAQVEGVFGKAPA